MNEKFDYHLARTLKGLQDDFDTSKSATERLKIAHAIDRLLDTANNREAVKNYNG